MENGKKLIKNLAAHSNLNRVNCQKSEARDTQTHKMKWDNLNTLSKKYRGVGHKFFTFNV